MIQQGTSCYLFKQTKDGTKRIYHRARPDNSMVGDSRWNTPDKNEAGFLTKAQWQDRSTKWMENSGWILESINGETEAL